MRWSRRWRPRTKLAVAAVYDFGWQFAPKGWDHGAAARAGTFPCRNLIVIDSGRTQRPPSSPAPVCRETSVVLRAMRNDIELRAFTRESFQIRAIVGLLLWFAPGPRAKNYRSCLFHHADNTTSPVRQRFMASIVDGPKKRNGRCRAGAEC